VAREKDLAARAAVRRVKPGMTLALGTGTTAALAERYPGGKGIAGAVASSRSTTDLAASLGFPVRELEANDHFDLMLDGADEVTPRLDLTKGGGGALLREKLLARLSDEVAILVDHTKLVPYLATNSPIPAEVVPFARPVIATQLAARQVAAKLRTAAADGAPWRSDNGNEILDLTPTAPLRDPAQFDAEVRALTGVIDTGIFVGLADRVYVGLPDGTVQEIVPAVPARAA
jgi:ribose 5-phosphate isomerase A